VQDNNQMDFLGSYSYGQMPDPPRKSKRFGWGSLLSTALICFILGALTACLVLPALASSYLRAPDSSASESIGPTVTPLPEDGEASGTTAETALPTPTPHREEIPLPQLGSETLPEIDPANPIVEISEKVGPSVVGVDTKVYVYSSTTERYLEEASSSGSGIVLTADGYIATNNHIIVDADMIYITVDGKDIPAEVVGTDASVDLAVLKADVTGLTPAALGDSSAVRVGEMAVAIGNPLGTLSGTVTQGIVSAVNREVNTDGKTQVYIQTDAAINPGNSGGALINAQGCVIGICSLKTVVAGYDEYGNAITAEGLGYAIPINDALPVIEQLIQYGYVPRPALGIMAYEMSQTDAEEWNAPKGVLVTSVRIGGPAETAGLMVDDIIVGIEGQDVESFNQMTRIVKSKTVGDSVLLKVWRDGDTMDVTVVIGDMNQIEETEKAILSQSTSPSGK